MGQYYYVYTKSLNGKERVFKPGLRHGNDFEREMLKLLEHSYINNEFVNHVVYWLYRHKPVRLVWCGDYAEPEECKELGFDYETVWEEDSPVIRTLKHREDLEANKEHLKYFINHSKQLYFDLHRYAKEGVFKQKGFDIQEHKECEWEECLHPVPLLTALGNGRGGGDYHDCYPNFKTVGSWAGGIVSVDDKIPEGYKEFFVMFKEEKEESETAA